MTDNIHKRKSEHIELSLTEEALGQGVTNGFDLFQFRHNALPEIDFDEIDSSSSFFGRAVKSPFVISSMTGGAEMAEMINRNLAIAAEEQGWIFALGSTRVMLESNEFRSSFQVRKYAPNTPIVANIGAVQLNYGVTIKQIKQIIEWTDADALVFHLNTIQEVIQSGGDTNFRNLLTKMEKVIDALSIPVGVKEVGFGIDGQTARRLTDIGASFIDVAGAGGTSWSQVEKLRSKEPLKKQAAEAFSSWGNPTAKCLQEMKDMIPQQTIVASGGIRTGLDAAKAIALSADYVGFARSILKEAIQSEEKAIEWMQVKELELKMVMFGIGVSSIEELQLTNRLYQAKDTYL
ncbi:type 2 isopentenyl-diphosphate Delta-isomerase [Gracilibacillus sp. S3-1-1]|uniref:Type 2 isopentenyl-diphosphate Delta-isomerase n=1 Tax=Gracilibacillus pellucidus TaxID=3095368 RepID=A0ACC6M607_9BACI|nr:type 2 isopentenyl-diphosphate Delta-isomerase [Gracilibacillus sp. S3-1-1]MDX8046379.1 type 2 isopentenyl-diphosphate Delta-isomerase [Gracilibacillus sp. S3-1-1]